MTRPHPFARFLADHRVRFLAVGAVNTILGYALFAGFYFWGLRYVPLGYLWSLVLSYAISIVVAFFLYRRFVFRVTGRVVRDFVGFVGVNAVAIAVNFLALPVLVELMQIPPLIAQATILFATVLISYFGHREVSFRRPKAED